MPDVTFEALGTLPRKCGELPSDIGNKMVIVVIWAYQKV